MSNENKGDTPSNIQTDAESQEYGAQHGQTPEGQNTGSSSPDADAPERTGEGTGAEAGSYS
jgi:hypothetical protein